MLNTVSVPDDLKAIAEKIIQIPTIASKRWIYTQYDSTVGTVNSSTNTPSDAAIVLVKGTCLPDRQAKKALALQLIVTVVMYLQIRIKAQ